MRKSSSVALLTLALSAARGMAEEAGKAAPLPYNAIGGGSFQLTIYLVLLLALFAGGVFLLRNGFTLFQPKMKGDRKLEISETRMLGNRQFLVVAAYEDRKVLIGVCPGRIDYLCTLSSAEPDFPNISPEKSDA